VRRALLVEGTRIARGDRAFTAPAREWTSEIVSADYAARQIVVAPAPEDPQALVGRYARITNDGGNDVTHLITAAQPVAGGVQFTLEYDPRIAAGPVSAVHEDGVETVVRLMFGPLYYKGKTLSNEDDSALYRTTGVRESRVYLDPQAGAGVTQAGLAGQFVDTNGDGTSRFTIYDYGPGDTVTVSSLISSGN